jgi:hypothetical protein
MQLAPVLVVEWVLPLLAFGVPCPKRQDDVIGAEADGFLAADVAAVAALITVVYARATVRDARLERQTRPLQAAARLVEEPDLQRRHPDWVPRRRTPGLSPMSDFGKHSYRYQLFLLASN